MSFKSVLDFHNLAIDKLVTQMGQQKNLLSRIKEVLPETLAQQTLHCVIHKNTLFIYTRAAVWSSQLRFYQSPILEAIAPLVGATVTQIRVKLVN